MSLKLSAIPTTAVALAPTDLLYLAKDMGGGSFLENKMPGSVLDARYVPQTRLINTTAPLTGGGDLSADLTFSMPAATGAVDGYLTAVDFTIFNNKQDAAPFLDTNPLIKGSADATKLLRFEVDGFTTATTRVLTPPNANATIAGLEVAQTFTAIQTIAARLLFSPDDTHDIGNVGTLRPANIYLAMSATVRRSNIGANIVSNGFVGSNISAASAGNQMFSPAIHLTGAGWATTPAASQPVAWRIYAQAVQGASNPTVNLLFDSEVNSAGFVNRLSISQAFISTTLTITTTANLQGSSVILAAAGGVNFTTRGFIVTPADGVFTFTNSAGANLTRINFGGSTSAFPALGRNGTILEVLAADGASVASLAVYNTKTSTTNFERLDLRWTSNVAEIFTEKGSGGGTARDLVIGRDATEVIRMTSTGMQMATAKVLAIASGTDQRAGNAVLVAGTVTVANTTVTANTLVMLTRKTAGGTLGTAITYTVTAATSFTITSDSALDTSTFSYVLIEVP